MAPDPFWALGRLNVLVNAHGISNMQDVRIVDLS